MTKVQRVRTLEDIPIDIFHAIKRGLVMRGVFPGGGEKIETSERTKHETAQKSEQNKSKQLTGEKLEGLADKSNEVLYKASSTFPYILFPDTITLDRVKVTIISKTFFFSARVISSPIEDILSAEAIVGPLFGTLKISSRYFTTNTRIVKYLNRDDAIRLQRLLQGYIIARERQIDCNKIEKHKLMKLLDNLGEESTKEPY